MLIIGKRYRLGYDYAHRGFPNNVRVPIQTRTARVRYRVDESVDLLEKAFGVSIPERAMDFFVGDRDKARVMDLLARSHISPDAFLVGLHPYFRRTRKKEPGWEHQKFALLIDRLVELHQATVIVTGSQADREHLRAILVHSKHADRVLNFAGTLSLQELGALLLRVHLFISVNTGPMHIAIALNVPTIGLMRASPAVITVPSNNPRFEYLVGNAEHASTPLNLDCETGSMIQNIAVEDVLDKVKSLMRVPGT
jgi:heptosyltransferase-2